MGNQQTAKPPVIKYHLKATGQLIVIDLTKDIKLLEPIPMPPKNKVNSEFKSLLEKVILPKKLHEPIRQIKSEKEKWNILIRHMDY